MNPTTDDHTLRAIRPQITAINRDVGMLAHQAGELDIATCDFGAAGARRDGDETATAVIYRHPSKRSVACEVQATEGMTHGVGRLRRDAGFGDEQDVAIYGLDDDVFIEEAQKPRTSGKVGWFKKLSSSRGSARSPTHKLFQQCIAEALGTGMIVTFGVGSVCSAVLTGYNAGGLWPVAVVWGLSVALAVASTVRCDVACDALRTWAECEKLPLQSL
jgi:Major intrinsic protein